MIAPMKDSTAAVLFGSREPEVDAGWLAGVARRLAHAIDNAPSGELRNWAWSSLQDYPTVPSEEEVAARFADLFTPPAMPEW